MSKFISNLDILFKNGLFYGFLRNVFKPNYAGIQDLRIKGNRAKQEKLRKDPDSVLKNNKGYQIGRFLCGGPLNSEIAISLFRKNCHSTFEIPFFEYTIFSAWGG